VRKAMRQIARRHQVPALHEHSPRRARGAAQVPEARQGRHTIAMAAPNGMLDGRVIRSPFAASDSFRPTSIPFARRRSVLRYEASSSLEDPPVGSLKPEIPQLSRIASPTSDLRSLGPVVLYRVKDLLVPCLRNNTA
jgi:hypothetical protein